MTMLFRYAQWKDCDVSVGEDTNILSYTDALAISEYAYPAMQWACGTGIIGGEKDTLFPNTAVARASMVQMFEKFLESTAK